MKKQWLSIVLVLCMVLCMAPATARAEESKTGTLKITVDISGVYEGDNVGDKTFSFEILRKYANYGHYKYVDITIKSGETEHTEYVPVEEGKYVVKQTGHATIDKYDWENASHQPGNIVESKELNVFAGKTERVTVHNFYEIAVTNEITELPIRINGYALNAKVGDIKASTEDQMRVTINKVTIKQRNASGGWDNLAPDATIQADIQYGVEILVNAKPGYTYASLTGDKVTVNGKEASEFENPSTQPGGDMRVFHEFEVLKVVKTVKSIEITTPPTKTEYKAGEKFDPTGMVVTVHYTDGTKAVLPETGYTIFYGDKLTQGQKDVTIQYNDGSGNSDIKVRQTITVGAYEGPHTHTYAGSRWYSDENSHWRQCTDKDCPDPHASATELASHTFVWKVDQAATTTQTGLKHEECTVCSHKRSENTEIPALRDYAVTVTGGTATVAAGTSITRAMEGVEVTVTADAPETGKVFDKWVVKAGGVTLANETSATTTFTMPGNDVKIEATYKDAPPSHTHSYGTWTMLDDSQHSRSCTCGDMQFEAHTFSAWTKVDESTHSRTCSKCKKSGEATNYTEIAEHTWVWVVDQEAALNQPGKQHEECTGCHAKRSENTEIPALRDYAVTVTGGTATVAAGTPITRAMEGVEVTVTAQAPAGTHFVKWVVKAGGVTLANETSATTTFTMSGNDVKIEATYKDAPPSHTHSYGVYVGMTYTAGNFIYQITSIDTATLGQSKVIGVVAAKKNKITKVTIPDRADCKGYGLNVTAVGDKAFAGCKVLKKLTIGNKVTVIGENAFKKCSNLKTVVIGKAVKTINSKAFIEDNKIKKITFKGKKLKTVKKNAFSKKAKKNIKSKKTKLKGNKKAIKLFKKKLKIK